MSSLFIELYLDEDVSVVIADLVRARGFSALTVREAGLFNRSDQEQLDYAVSKQKALLTHNRYDFEKLAQEYFAAGKLHCGIIIAVRRSPYEIARRLLIILNHVTADEMKNQLRYI